MTINVNHELNNTSQSDVRTKEAKVVSIINMKGGVGKTTLCIGIADYLAHYRKKKKILVIDADPQFNSTQALLDAYLKGDYFADILPKQKTINRLFRPQVDFSQHYESPKADEIIVELSDTLDILCGDLNLVLANKSSDYSYVRRLNRFIKDNNLKEVYDLILIDCPPTLTIYTDSALMASDYYLIPNRIDRYSIIGISSLQKAINNLKREEEINLECLGLVYTIIETELTKKQREMKETFEARKELQDLYVFTATLSFVKDIQVGKQGPIPTRYLKSRDDIVDLSKELLDRLEVRCLNGA